MSAETLRGAARLIRAYAVEATPGPWINRRGPGDHVHGYDMTTVADVTSREDRRYIASWHPAVALAVADWLETTAREFDALNIENPMNDRQRAALAAARAYLGDDA